MNSSNRLVVAILVVAGVAIAFWVLALGPKREQADELGQQVEQLHLSVEEAQSKVIEASAAKRDFPADYRQLVTLGAAVPAGDETSSLLVELNHIAERSKVTFDSLQLNSGSGEAAAPAPAPAPAPAAPETGAEPSNAVPASATVPPTEVAASELPLGASIGPAGLNVMPYNLTFSGNFFHIADFIKGLDSLVHTGGSEVAVDGRLVTLDGFALNANAELDFPHLDATFAVTTYITPPEQGLTAGATPAAPAPSTTTPAAESAPAESAANPASETVAAR